MLILLFFLMLCFFPKLYFEPSDWCFKTLDKIFLLSIIFSIFVSWFLYCFSLKMFCFPFVAVWAIGLVFQNLGQNCYAEHYLFYFCFMISVLFSIRNVMFLKKLYFEPSDWCFKTLDKIFVLIIISSVFVSCFWYCFILESHVFSISCTVSHRIGVSKSWIKLLCWLLSLLFLFHKCYVFSKSCTVNHRNGVSKSWVKFLCWLLSFLF